MTDLHVNFVGIELKNPLIASAGPITANIDNVRRLIDSGIAAIVTKTGFVKKEYEQWVGRKNIFPYKPVYKYQSLKNGKLLSLPTLSEIPVSEMARRVEIIKNLHIPVIGSIMGLSPAGYKESARILASAGVDAIELDLCCPIPEFTTSYKWAGQNVNFYPKKYAHLVDTVKSIVSIPVGVKSTVSLYLYGNVIEGLIRSKLKNSMPDFITLVGQLDENPGVNLDTLTPLIPNIPTFGWQGTLSKLTYSALATFSSTMGTDNPVLSASGGIRDYKGVINSLALGATTIQFQTAILDKGPRVISNILKNLDDYLTSHRISTISQMIGVASRTYIPSIVLGKFMLERDTLLGTLYAVVDGEKCTGCGICKDVCTEHAVEIRDKRSWINEKMCRGCNLCVLKCPEETIHLANFECLENLIEKYKNSEIAKSFSNFMNKEKIGLFEKLTIFSKLRKWGLA
jgi:dihydroorotate dehydrogenase/ferredoxin